MLAALLAGIFSHGAVRAATFTVYFLLAAALTSRLLLRAQDRGRGPQAPGHEPSRCRSPRSECAEAGGCSGGCSCGAVAVPTDVGCAGAGSNDTGPSVGTSGDGDA
jgi:hypothetical protein